MFSSLFLVLFYFPPNRIVPIGLRVLLFTASSVAFFFGVDVRLVIPPYVLFLTPTLEIVPTLGNGCKSTGYTIRLEIPLDPFQTGVAGASKMIGSGAARDGGSNSSIVSDTVDDGRFVGSVVSSSILKNRLFFLSNNIF
jgi:hypothetical protein